MKEWILEFWRPFLEIFLISFVIYRILLFIRGTRAMQVLKGMLFLLIAFFLAQYLSLHTFNIIITKIFTVAIIAILIIFQPEFRRALATLGGRSIFEPVHTKETILDSIVDAAVYLSKKKYGAIIAIENEMSLGSYIDSGTRMDAVISVSLLTTIFFPNSNLHDGGVIIQGDVIASSGCLFPFSSRTLPYYGAGTRHLAALGLSEETDAVIVVVSEESGNISVVHRGKMMQNTDQSKLKKILFDNLIKHKKNKFHWRKKKEV